MLLMTPEYAAMREERARQTIEWLVGNFDLRPIPRPVVARLNLAGGRRRRGGASAPEADPAAAV